MHSMAQINKFKICKAQSNKRLVGIVVFIAAINILFYWGLWYFQIWSPFALISLSSVLLILFQYKKEQRLLQIQKNAQIIQLLVSSGFPTTTYHPEKKVFQKDFIRSRLYDDLPFIYKGNRLLKTKNWLMSNITVSKKLSKKKEPSIVFDGIFIKFKNQSQVNGALVIKPLLIPDKTEIPAILQSLVHRYFTSSVSNTSTGNKAFDKRFEVFNYTPESQSKVLTSNVINSILEIENKLNDCFSISNNALDNSKIRKTALEISFVENYIYIGIRGLKLFTSSKNCNNIKAADEFQKCIEFIKLISQINNNPKTIKS